MQRRFESITPLSREHHHALVLCLRIHRRAGAHKDDLVWLKEQTRKTILFFESDLVPHFHAEESILFPAISKLPPSTALLAEVIAEHEEIRRQIDHLRQLNNSTDPAVLTDALMRFADLLEAHIRKEERRLFPLYQENVPTEEDALVGQAILQRLGTGMKPRHPEFLT